MKPPAICLYPEFVSDIQKTINIGKKATYSRIVVPITNQPLSQSEPRDQRNAFTRSDLLLNATSWSENTILKVGEFHDCDSCDEKIWKKSIQNLKLEIDWAKHQNSDQAIVMVSLKSDQCANMAREFLNRFDKFGMVLAEMPMVDKSYFTQMYTKTEDKIELSTASANIWHRWNHFRFTVDFNPQFKVKVTFCFSFYFRFCSFINFDLYFCTQVALELTPELPNESDLNRWCGEPVHLIIIPSDLFKITSNNNDINLDECLRNVCLKFLQKTGTHFAVRCNLDDPWMNRYAIYLRKLFSTTTQPNNHVYVHLTQCILFDLSTGSVRDSFIFISLYCFQM